MRIKTLLVTTLMCLCMLAPAEAKTLAVVWWLDLKTVPTYTTENMDYIRDYVNKEYNGTWNVEFPQAEYEAYRQELGRWPNANEFCQRYGYDHMAALGVRGSAEHITFRTKHANLKPVYDLKDVNVKIQAAVGDNGSHRSAYCTGHLSKNRVGSMEKAVNDAFKLCVEDLVDWMESRLSPATYKKPRGPIWDEEL